MLSDRSRPVVEATLPVIADHIEEIAAPLLRAPVRRPPGAAGRHVQPGQPGRGHPAGGAGRLGRRVRQRAGEDPEQLPEHLLPRIAHKHASLGITPGPVPGRARQPVLGDRRRARRRGHPGGGGGLGRGLLADGLRADQHGARPLQRARRAPGDGLARVAGGGEDPGDRRRRHLPGRGAPTTGWSGPRCPASTSRSRCRCPTGSTSRGSTASPAPTTASTASSRSSGCAAAASPTARCRTLLCDPVQVGDVLTLSLPFGDVVLDDSGRPAGLRQRGHRHHPDGRHALHLVAAGSRLPITLLHADVDEASFALRQQVLDDVARLPNAALHVWYEHGAHGTRCRSTACTPARWTSTTSSCRRAPRYYLCGPLPFMQAGPQRPDRPGRAATRHPVRGVRPRPVAGRPGHRADAGRRSTGLRADRSTALRAATGVRSRPAAVVRGGSAPAFSPRGPRARWARSASWSAR